MIRSNIQFSVCDHLLRSIFFDANLILYSGLKMEKECNKKYVCVWLCTIATKTKLIVFWFFFLHSKGSQYARRLKKVQTKKKSWNQFHEILFWPKSIFCNLKNGQKSFFFTGEKFKTAKNAISRKKMIYLISRVFLPGLF